MLLLFLLPHPSAQSLTRSDAEASTEPVFIDVPTKSELEEVPPMHAWQKALRRESTCASAETKDHISVSRYE
jgi:hypothetical protein